ncbi:MAG TPA: flagellar motor protein MotB [Bryobacteraceae bacterium]|nr:flagellar motor protein MotB [Bryobacteraceae bacterium]
MASGKPNHHPPIIVVKKVVAHGGHHGGAWKVAYADFVTALMALFIVLWLLSSNGPVKQAVADYFKDPTGHKKQIGSGLSGEGEAMLLSKQDLGQLKDKLNQALHTIPDFKKLQNQVSMNVTSEGLRIELIENPNGCFFERGSAQPTALGIEVITVLAQQLGELQNNILLEGHTDSTPYGPGQGYTNWELSADRANAARRIMQMHGVRPDQVKAIRGYADQRLRNTSNPADPSNRRISVVVAYQPDDMKTLEIPKGGKLGVKLKAAEDTKSSPPADKKGA